MSYNNKSDEQDIPLYQTKFSQSLQHTAVKGRLDKGSILQVAFFCIGALFTMRVFADLLWQEHAVLVNVAMLLGLVFSAGVLVLLCLLSEYKLNPLIVGCFFSFVYFLVIYIPSIVLDVFILVLRYGFSVYLSEYPVLHWILLIIYVILVVVALVIALVESMVLLQHYSIGAYVRYMSEPTE